MCYYIHQKLLYKSQAEFLFQKGQIVSLRWADTILAKQINKNSFCLAHVGLLKVNMLFPLK